MKYVIKKISDNFLFEEIDQARVNFVESLNRSLETATIVFDKGKNDPLDFYLGIDFQHTDNEGLVYCFNLRDELVKDFQQHQNDPTQPSFQQLPLIAEALRNLATELDAWYAEEPKKSIEKSQDEKDTEFAMNIRRSYKEVLRDAMRKDEAEGGKSSVFDQLKQTLFLKKSS